MQGSQWWLEEQPVEVRTQKNVLRYYPKAGRLQLSRPDRLGLDGMSTVGKTVSLDLQAVRDAEQAEDAIALLQQVMDSLKGGV